MAHVDFPGITVTNTSENISADTTGWVPTVFEPWPTTAPVVWPTTTYHYCNCGTYELTLSQLMSKLKDKLEQEQSDKESAKELVKSLKKFLQD